MDLNRTWLREAGATDPTTLPPPAEIAANIADELTTALARLRAVAARPGESPAEAAEGRSSSRLGFPCPHTLVRHGARSSMVMQAGLGVATERPDLRPGRPAEFPSERASEAHCGRT